MRKQLATRTVQPIVTRPYLFLDIDGVLTPLTLKPQTKPAWKHTIVIPDLGFHAVTAPELLDQLAATNTDRHWVTTWAEDANRCFARPVGWEPLPVHTPTRDTNSSGWWKLDCVLNQIRQDARPFIWTDDHIADQLTHIEPALRTITQPWLLISPDRTVGLTPHDVATITRFTCWPKGHQTHINRARPHDHTRTGQSRRTT